MRILVVDQFDICRMGMKTILRQLNKDCVFLEAETIGDGVEIAGDADLDLVIIDLDVPEIGANGMLNAIKKSGLQGKFILFSVQEEYEIMRKAYEMGISAFISEQTKKEIILSVFQIVLAGGKYFSPEVIGGQPKNKNRTSKGALSIASEGYPILSNRQYEVLRLLSEGKPNKVIARELDIATGTVKVHIAGILKSLKARNRTQAVSIAQHINII